MVRVSVEVREGDDLFEVAVYADTISQAVATARGRFPGHAVRVVFPIDGEDFFGGHRRGRDGGRQPAGASAGPGSIGMDRSEGAVIHRSQRRRRQEGA